MLVNALQSKRKPKETQIDVNAEVIDKDGVSLSINQHAEIDLCAEVLWHNYSCT